MGKPNCRGFVVRHDSRSLHLEFLLGVVKVNRHNTRVPTKDETEFHKKGLLYSIYITARGDLRAGEIDGVNIECEAFGESTESWSSNMLIETRVAMDIYIFH